MSHKTKWCHIYGTDLFNASVDLDECLKLPDWISKNDPIQHIYVKSVIVPLNIKKTNWFWPFWMGSRHPLKLVLFPEIKIFLPTWWVSWAHSKSHNHLVFLILRGTIQIFYIYMLDGVIFGNFGYVFHPRSFKIFCIRWGPRTH